MHVVVVAIPILVVLVQNEHDDVEPFDAVMSVTFAAKEIPSSARPVVEGSFAQEMPESPAVASMVLESLQEHASFHESRH